MEEMDQMYVPVTRTFRLNERHYGALQGLNKADTLKKYGEAQVLEWRRSYGIPPPPVEETSEHYPKNQPRFKNVVNPPKSESLKSTGGMFVWFNG